MCTPVHGTSVLVARHGKGTGSAVIVTPGGTLIPLFVIPGCWTEEALESPAFTWHACQICELEAA